MYNKNFDIFKVKSIVNKGKIILNIGMILCTVLCLTYIMYYGMMSADDILYESTKHVFFPIANFFNPNETGYVIYRNTAFWFAFLIIPQLFGQYLLDKFEEEAKKTQLLIEEEKIKNAIKETKKDKEFEYEIIKNYSICLSLDYESSKEITKESKIVLNRTIFKKLGEFLLNIENTAKISISDVLIYTSQDFAKYDLIYDTFIKSLAKIKDNIKSKHDINIIPSMTTDAFCNIEKLNKIRQSHFEIQSFNHKNRALSSATFAKKYKHLKHKKYAGIPIGEYAYFKDNKTDTYELNVIHKNLTTTLNSIKD